MSIIDLQCDIIIHLFDTKHVLTGLFSSGFPSNLITVSKFVLKNNSLRECLPEATTALDLLRWEELCTTVSPV